VSNIAPRSDASASMLCGGTRPGRLDGGLVEMVSTG